VARKVVQAPQAAGNYVSEWFGRRIYPAVRLDGIGGITGANKNVCPFLTEMQSAKTECWKRANSKGVCTISSASNRAGTPARRVRQDWLVCPHRVIHTDLVKESCARIFGNDAMDQYPIPVSALRSFEKLDKLKSNIRESGRGFLFFQDKGPANLVRS